MAETGRRGLSASQEKEFVGHLRTRRGIRRSKKGHIRGRGRGQIVGAVSIRERPAAQAFRHLAGKVARSLAVLAERVLPIADASLTRMTSPN